MFESKFLLFLFDNFQSNFIFNIFKYYFSNYFCQFNIQFECSKTDINIINENENSY